MNIIVVMCCANLFQNLSVEAKVEATIQLEISRLAAENLVRCGAFSVFLVIFLDLWFLMFLVVCLY